MKRLFVTGIIIVLSAITAMAEQLTAELISKTLREGSEAFENISIEKANKAARFDIKLGESTAAIGDEHIFDGFRFTAPEGNKDLVWYFNTPSHWGHWYILPLTGAEKQGFRRWLDADKVYKHFDGDGVTNRLRVLQTLDGEYFEAGNEYLIWFRRTEQGASTNVLRGVLAFADPCDYWGHDEIEEALALKPKSAEHQVELLGSRGGTILLDEEFFRRDDALRRIDNVFSSLRQTHRAAGGLYMTMEISCPPCKSEPSLSDIRKKHGEPDFIQSAKEERRVRKHAGGDVEDEPEDITTYYYDYFGLKVSSRNKKDTVIGVVTHANDFSAIQPQDSGSHFSKLSMKNLTVLHSNNEEVGRLYYFMEGGKEPLCIKEPPKNVFKRENQTLEYLGDGEWIWTTLYEDEQLARTIPFKQHRMNGVAKGFHRNGQPSFAASYKNGELDGEVSQYAEDGTQTQCILYKAGERVSSQNDLTKKEADLFPGDIPKRVRYTRPQTEAAEAARLLLSNVFLQEKQDKLFGEAAAVYPSLWQEIKDSKPYSEDSGTEMTTYVDGTKMEGKGLKEEASKTALTKLLQGKFPASGKTIIRPPNYNDLQKYWSVIAWDLENPLFVVEAEQSKYIFEFQDGYVFTVYDLN